MRNSHIAAILLLGAAISGCGDSGGDSSSRTQRKVEPVSWVLSGKSHGRVIRFSVNTSHCTGDPEPQLGRTKISESAGRAVIRTYVSVPIRKPSSRKGCFGTLVNLLGSVRLKQPVKSLDIFDGFFSPPKLESAFSGTRRRPGVAAVDNERPVRWQLGHISGDRVVHLGVGVPYCSGAPKPGISRVRTQEHDDSVIITAFVTPKKSSKGGGACAGLELGFSEEVELSEPLNGRQLLDGSTSPPQRRGPRR